MDIFVQLLKPQFISLVWNQFPPVHKVINIWAIQSLKGSQGQQQLEKSSGYQTDVFVSLTPCQLTFALHFSHNWGHIKTLLFIHLFVFTLLPHM